MFVLAIYNHSNGLYYGSEGGCCGSEEGSHGSEPLHPEERIRHKELHLTMSNFLELNLKHFVRSAMFEIDGHKWYLGIYPRGDPYSTSYLSLYLCMDASDKLPPESGKLVELSLSIMDQKHGQHYTRKSPALVVFAGECRWGWSNFIPLSIFRDPSSGYLVRSCCIVKAEITIVGSSSGGEVLADGQMN
ncbi:hypothetical protein CFC21_011254 [Triticum aestivum]|uniref:MATH domain-containing protein n=2 Tax=Triticum aestivum TaxID=4565 RepID=A0A9R1IVT1_WHEAT|nr:ubiquitin C-terminal hydrolase 12-like [Triticum aestivum]KAF6994592.1 hypothetical protein CFC21_011254 [Triticum aestivum]